VLNGLVGRHEVSVCPQRIIAHLQHHPLFRLLASPFFRIVRERFDEFEKVYPERVDKLICGKILKASTGK
jgi:hypothetical protein